MTSPGQLNRLLHQALHDKSAEPAFFRALLDAEVYAHAPQHDDTGRLRLIQFTRPDGLTVLPFFSDEAQAHAASRLGIRVLSMTGRELMASTRGATLMFNPNDVHCTLYPEEVTALLDRGEVATVQQVDVDERSVLVGSPAETLAWLTEPLRVLYRSLECVRAAYLVEFRAPENPDRAVLVIGMAVARRDADRAARATITTIQLACQSRKVEVDLAAFDPDRDLPEWLAATAVGPFYVSG